MNVHFGGPDQAPRALRNLLESHVDAVPTGGSIDWMTYYFRDEALAEALVRAHQRGARVRVCVEGLPRHRGANDRVVEILKAGIGDGLRVDQHLFGACHLHTKLYCFGGPQPHALVGSFNPSGNEPEDAAVIADIGDQDRGHNLLVEIDDPKLVQALAARASFDIGSEQAFFFPRLGGNPLDARLAELGSRSKLRVSASHLSDGRTGQLLVRLVERGATVEVLTHHTLRRSPKPLVQFLRSGGVRTYRYEHPEEVPMHAKFILAEDGERRWSAFGSYNLSRMSRWLNQELLMFSDDSQLCDALDRRWREIMAEPWAKA
jgi:phosphatidylserine/phosphatidylglycerophosphate/cardiolipin synthase-like enzyme